jgi:UDPglucose 6-dehydrogenase
MNCTILGMGKLGAPVAVAMSLTHEVIGYDTDTQIMSNLHRDRKYPHRELGLTLEDDFQDYLNRSTLALGCSLRDSIKSSEVIFIAVQTPHQPEFDGTQRLTDKREDFDYSYLVKACKSIIPYVEKHQVVSIISTVLPGTIRREILPIFKDRCHVVYNPFFIAMGTVMKDFLLPEFVLMGGDNKEALDKLRQFYLDIYREDKSISMSIESAELTKVAYNTYLTSKITIANALMEIAHKIPHCNIDDVSLALSKATQRVVSAKYMQGGLCDSGPCHPRDNIAMSHLARLLDLSSNYFDDLMMTRENQTDWLVNLFLQEAGDLPKVLLGKAYKPETNLTIGSGAYLCANLLKERKIDFIHHDPIVSLSEFFTHTSYANAYLITTKHKVFSEMKFPKGSVVVDPFRYILPQESVKIISVGIGK